MRTAWLVFLGGGLGSVGRWLVGLAALRAFGPGFPAGTLAVNLAGGLVMGMLARLLGSWAGPASVRWIDTRFAAMLPVLESLDCEGVVEAVEPAPGGVLATVKLSALRSDGSVVSSGSALVFVKA
jgi:CrcB protein